MHEKYSVKKRQSKAVLNLDYLLMEVMDTFHRLLRENPYETGKNRDEIEKQLTHKKELRNALKNCVYGDRRSKIYVKEYLKDILIRKYKINKESIEESIPFSSPRRLTVQDKFEILLYFYKRTYHSSALEQLIEENSLDRPVYDEEENPYYEITAEDITALYDRMPVMGLHFNDRLNILAQRLYQNFKGNGVIDEIRDMKIDGVSGGVSGIPEGVWPEEASKPGELPKSCDSVWIFYKGKSIHLSFLSFQSQKELVRVCKNIYRYNNPGQLSEAAGHMVNEMQDGSRVAVARPPFCESWVFFIRKFDSVLNKTVDHLITDGGNEIPIQVMKWLVKGCQVTGITGEQGSGKTTLLMALIGYINPAYNLRIQELSFELHLRKVYPNRNIVTFRETESVSGQEGLDFQKKTDGAVNILGEVASAEVSAWLVQMAQVASSFTLFTHHAKTTGNLVAHLRNALLKEGGFRDERVATEQVTDAIRFDIHMKKDVDGHRYIERITEILPRDKKHNYTDSLTGSLFETRDIVVRKDGRYLWKNKFSRKTCEEITGYLKNGEREVFRRAMEAW